MKKLLLIVLATVLTIALYSQSKLADKDVLCERGSKGDAKSEWALKNGNFNVQDISGTTHDLNAYLDAGKTVIIDFSCAWCSPCWTLHQSGVLDDLHNTYGPEGTDELVVLWVEIESTNTLAQIQGQSSGTSTDHDTYSQGDWTVGGTWPVPIIDSRSPLTPLQDLYEGYVPTVFMVCPSGYYKVITEECRVSASSVYAQVGTCPASGQVPVAEISGPGSGYINNNISFTAEIMSIDPVTVYAWTFEGGTPSTSDQGNPSVSWTSAGEYEITLTASNENGTSNIATKTITIVDPGNIDDMFVTFEEILVNSTLPASMAPYNWTTVDMDGGTIWGDLSDFGVSGTNNAFVVYSTALVAATSFGNYPAYQGDKCAIAMTNNTATGNGSFNNDWLISPQIQLGDNSSFSLYVRSTITTWGTEEYKIAVSTTNNTPSSFSVLGGQRTAPGSWTLVTVDLAEYDNQEIYIAVNYVGQDHFAFMVDNLKIETRTVNTDLSVLDKINIYPNPANDILNITSAEGANIKIFNLTGQEIMNIDSSSEIQKINISNLEQGIYVVQIIKDNNTVTRKITISK